MHDSKPSLPVIPAFSASSAASTRAVVGIALLLAGYAAAALFGWPQHGRDLLVQAQAAQGVAVHDDGPGHDAAAHGGMSTSPPPLTVLPFAVLLAAIAILPLTSHLSHW